jgi:hypothetical protein
MRKLVLGLAAASSLAFASAANAAVTVTNTANVLPTYTVVNGATQSTIAFSQNPEPGGVFSGWFEFTNTLPGLYSIIVGTSTPGATITDLTLSGTGGSPVLASSAGTTNTLSLLADNLASGDYRFTFAGQAPPQGGVVSGNLTFQIVPVPEPATWGMMLVGFAGIGFAMRRSRRPALAQIA